MQIAVLKKFNSSTSIVVSLIYPAIIVLTGIVFLNQYIQWNLPTFLLGVLSIVISAHKKPAYKKRYLFAALLMLLIAIIIPVKTFLFFALSFTLFYWIENRHASIGFLGIASLVLSCPVFEYGITVFSFPIRIQLASWVGELIGSAHSGISVSENLISQNGYEFSVDPACMGLNMFTVSFLIGIIFMGLLQRKTGKKISVKFSIFYLSGLLLLNIIANLIRIIILVQFRILPDNFLHDVIGLVCFLLYLCVPAAIISKWLVMKFGVGVGLKPSYNKRFSFIQFILLAGLIVAAIRINSSDSYTSFNKKFSYVITGYHSSLFAPGIIKLESEKALIYVKSIRGFYDTEHNPTLCWKGSGYEFIHTARENTAGINVFVAELRKNNESMYTAWWYDNGINTSIDQWEWRWDMLRGSKNYAVINVTSANKLLLEKEIEILIKNKSLKQLLTDN